MQMRERGLLTRLVRTRPMLLAAIFYLIGCALAYALDAPREALIASVVLPLLPIPGLYLRRHRRWIAPLLILTMLPVGALRFSIDWHALDPLPDQKGAQLSGRICQTPVWNADTERVICVLEDLTVDGAPVKGRIRLYLRGEEDVSHLASVALGQRVDCTAHIWRADGATNPGQFNFSNYLRLNGLRGYATAKIEDATLSPPESRASDLPERLRARIGARIDRLFPNNAALARALLLGDRSGLSQEEREAYSKTGTAHLLAISGMHVSALSMAVSLLLGRFLRRSRAFCVTLILLLLYGGLIGFSASLFRAILMFAVFGFAPLAGRYSDAPTRIAAAMLAYLFIRPIGVLEAGFILSYGAAAGIILLSAPLTRLFHGEAFLQKHTKVSFSSIIRLWFPQWLLRSLIVTLAAQIATLPAVIHFFSAQPLWSFAVNLIAVPLTMAAYLVSILGALTGFAPVAAVGDFLYGLLTRCIAFFSALPLSSVRVARFPAWLLLLCAVACLLASDISRLPEKLRRFLPATVLLAVLISNLCARTTTAGCSIVFLDAGQADCAVLRAQGKVYLIDTGDTYTPAADYLSAMNYALEGVFLSHPHADHAGGLESILDICTPKTIYITANWDSYAADEGVAEALALAEAQGAEIIRLSAGDALALSKDVNLRVLSPKAGFPADSANEDSMILRVEYGAASALFCGDASAASVCGLAGDIDILKVGHHGSANSVNAALLAETAPSVSIVSVGYNNYGHPNPEALELLAASGSRIYRTDQCGAITCHLRADGAVFLRSYRNSEGKNEME